MSDQGLFYSDDDVPEIIEELPPCPNCKATPVVMTDRDCRITTTSVYCASCGAEFFVTPSMFGSNFDDTRAVCAKYIAWRKDPDSLVGYRGNGEWT